MFHKRFILSSAAALIALAVGCSKSPDSPVSPSSSTEPSTAAAADGSKLKATAPTAVSPINNAQPDGSIVLVSTKSTGKFADITPSYEFEVKNGAGATVYSRVTGGEGAGANVSHTVEGSLEFDAAHTWRVRAVLAGAAGPWSAAASFRTPSGGYINSNPEVFDPLTNGRTVGTRIGGTEFIPGTGLELLTHDSRVSYQLPQNLQQGELSVMVTGIDEGSSGDKTKIMSMQEGGGNDLTDNDYRMTVEKRGRHYETPGAVVFRIIMGDANEHAGRIFDSGRRGVGFSDERWYFWKFTWGNRAALEVREDGPNGRVIYADSRGTGSFIYRPVPHFVHLGAPVGRAGPGDASIPGAIYKNLWVSARPRPTFPGE